jgi:hypothetical protein
MLLFAQSSAPIAHLLALLLLETRLLPTAHSSRSADRDLFATKTATGVTGTHREADAAHVNRNPFLERESVTLQLIHRSILISSTATHLTTKDAIALFSKTALPQLFHLPLPLSSPFLPFNPVVENATTLAMISVTSTS